MLLVQEMAFVSLYEELSLVYLTILLDVSSAVLRDQIFIFVTLTSHTGRQFVHDLLLIKEATFSHQLFLLGINDISNYLRRALGVVIAVHLEMLMIAFVLC